MFLMKADAHTDADYRARVRYRDDLVKFLRPFAQEGKVVEEADIRELFEEKIETAKQGEGYAA